MANIKDTNQIHAGILKKIRTDHPSVVIVVDNDNQDTSLLFSESVGQDERIKVRDDLWSLYDKTRHPDLVSRDIWIADAKDGDTNDDVDAFIASNPWTGPVMYVGVGYYDEQQGVTPTTSMNDKHKWDGVDPEDDNNEMNEDFIKATCEIDNRNSDLELEILHERGDGTYVSIGDLSDNMTPEQANALANSARQVMDEFGFGSWGVHVYYGEDEEIKFGPSED